MKISRAIRTSYQDINGNWRTEEISVELSHEEVGIKEVSNHRDIGQILAYECDVLLCKSIKDPAMKEYVEERVKRLKEEKVQVDELRKRTTPV